MLCAIRERCASFMILTATVSEICGRQTNVSILVVYNFVVANITLHVKHTVNMLCMLLLLFLCIYYYVCGCNISQKVEGHDRLRLQQTRQLMMIIIIGN